MLVYSPHITPRLQYIAGFIGKEIRGEPFTLTSDINYFSDYPDPKINYSRKRHGNGEFFIFNHSLLEENFICEQEISCFEAGNRTPGMKAFFRTDGDYPFDVFAAAFYLLSRYEEYLPHKKDKYGRYAHENSLAFKEGFLQVPMVNLWLEDFKKAIKEKFPALTFRSSPFRFQPTYDIDEAFAFINKNPLRVTAGLIRSAIYGEWKILKRQLEVAKKQASDPYDAYDWLNDLHEKYRLNPVYFFHMAFQKGKYDKNISPSHPALHQLIRRHADKYSLGIHPSWKSNDKEGLLKQEIRLLENISAKKITSSRQHYIRFTLPHTFRRLQDAGIRDDYSMGYGSINGFRASVASEFYWYDLEKEQTTSLLLHPFCFMETNSFFEQKYLPQRAFEEMMHYYHVVKSVNGLLIFIWHNSFLGSHPHFTGWKEIYREFVSKISRTNNYIS